MRRFLIFVLAGPELGLIGLGLAAALSGYDVMRSIGLMIGPGIMLAYLFGFLPAIFTYTLDEALTQGNISLWWRIALCGAFGGLLSAGLIHASPFILQMVSAKEIFSGLPGGLAGAACSYWSGPEKWRPKERGIGWNAEDRH